MREELIRSIIESASRHDSADDYVEGYATDMADQIMKNFGWDERGTPL